MCLKQLMEIYGLKNGWYEDDKMKKLTSSEVKEKLVRILTSYARYCDEHGLRYYLCGGTLLGAVRHKGFIPWDDDIDVCMPRPDYEKLIELQKDKKTMEIRCPELGNAEYPFMKIVDTEVKIKQQSIRKDNAFLWIDVFPLDGWPDDIYQASRLQKRLKLFHDLLVYAHAEIGFGTTKLRAALKIPLVYLARIIGAKRISGIMNDISQKYSFETSEWVGGVVWSSGYGMKERMPRSVFQAGNKFEFEGEFFYVPRGWNEYLRNLYGDYMKLPPMEKRVNHSVEAYIRECKE